MVCQDKISGYQHMSEYGVSRYNQWISVYVRIWCVKDKINGYQYMSECIDGQENMSGYQHRSDI